jgi:hypothetical protein
MNAHQKQLLINLSISGFVPVIYWIYGEQLPMNEAWEVDYFKGGLILLVLLFGMLGGMVELAILRRFMKGTFQWFLLSFLATAGHLILFMAAMKYMGIDLSTQRDDSVNGWLIFAGIFFTFYFLFELLFAMVTEVEVERKYERIFGWNDVLLALYASFGAVYMWEILLSNMAFTFQNWSYFLLAELLPASFLFILIVLPFKRYFIIERKLLIRTKRQELIYYLSYLLMILVGLAPRVLEVLDFEF